MGTLKRFWDKFYSWFNRLSLFIKVGFVMGFCEILIIVIFISMYLQLSQVEKKMYKECEEYLTASFYLKNLLLTDESPEKKELAIEEARKLLDIMLNGGSVTIKEHNKKFAFPLDPKGVCGELTDLKELSKILSKKNLSTKDYKLALYKVDDYIYYLLSETFKNREEIKHLIFTIKSTEFVLLVILGVVLLGGAAAFFIMVLIPLKKATSKIHQIAYTEHIEDVSDRVLKVPFKDEIGKLVNEVNELIRYFAELNKFKRVLEEDPSLDDIFLRLANLLKEKFHLDKFVIYTVSNSNNTMRVVYKEPEDINVNQEILVIADLCRAKRTGRIISSLETKGICQMFVHPNSHHICIPLLCSGKVVGVLQIIFGENEKERIKQFLKEMPHLNAFLEQMLPVLEAKRYAEFLKQMSIKDPLTGLYNRRFVEQALENITAGVMRRNTVLGVLMCDIDYFKKVNDEYGHDVGDEILKGVAKILKENVRKSDIVSRFGGEEFLILLVDIRKGEAEKIAEKLRKRVEETTFHTKAGPIKKTISIGVSEFPVDSTGIWQVIKFADVALYKAKETGRNKVVRFKPEMWESYSNYLKKK